MPTTLASEAHTGQAGWQDRTVPDAYPVFELPEKAEEVLEIVDQIPEGKVLTYGDVAELVGSRGARFVGNIMSRYGSDVPWWRVVRGDGRIVTGNPARQAALLRAEGVVVRHGRVVSAPVGRFARRGVRR